MENGYKFVNADMILTCLSFHGAGNRNVGFFQRKSDGMYITARNISQDKEGTYSWAWGHYFANREDAETDYQKRLKEMLSYND